MRSRAWLHLLLVVSLSAPIVAAARSGGAEPASPNATLPAFRDRDHALAAEIEDALARLDESGNDRFQNARGDIRGEDRLPMRLEAARAQADLHKAREDLESLREEARRAGAPAALISELEDVEPAAQPEKRSPSDEAAVTDLETKAQDYRARAERNRGKIDSGPEDESNRAASCRERYERRAKGEDEIAEQYERLADEFREDSAL